MPQQGEILETPLKIIGAGFGRTGTASLKLAFQKLGHKTHHMNEFKESDNSDQKEAFYDILSQSKEDRIKNKAWNELLMKPYGYSACCDWPTSFYFDELLAQNPNAKVVLTVRDSGEKWYESTKNSIYKVWSTMNSWPMWVVASLVMSKKARLGMKLVLKDTVWDNPKLFDGKFEDKERSIKVYYTWIDFVKEKVPKDQLLVFNVKEGWDPLCKFLEVEKPKDCEQFPRSNTTQEVLKEHRYVCLHSNEDARLVLE